MHFVIGCAPTYSKERICEGVINLCKKEYNITIDARVSGNTLVVYLPAENLFDAVLNLDTGASKKINDVILGVSRVTLSTAAKLDFYVVIAQDPGMPEIEIVYIRYVEDVKRFLLGDLSRGEYAKRAVITIKTPPQAEREKILKELFSKLNVQNADEMIKEYLGADEAASGIGDISYWNNKFFIKEIGISEFLAAQIAERVKIDLRQDSQINRLYELNGAEGRFIKSGPGEDFIFNINLSPRVEPLYLESGLEIGAQKRRILIFKKLCGIIGNTLWAYRFESFRTAEISALDEKKIITKERLWALRHGRLSIEDVL